MATNERAKAASVGFRSSGADERNADRAARLVAERVRLGLTQERFARAMGVGVRTYKRYEAGERSPSLDDLGSLVDLGVDLNWIAAGGDAPRPADPAAGIPTELKERLDQACAIAQIQPPTDLNWGDLQRLAARGLDVHWLLTGQGAALWGAPSETEPYSKHEVNENLLAGVISAVVGQAHRQNQPLTPQQLGMTVAKVYAEQAAKTEAQVAREVAALGAGPINRTKP